MEQYYDVINELLPLLSTMEEGIVYVKKQMNELRYEEALIILQDISEGMESIENAIRSIKVELPLEEIETLSTLIKESMAQVVSDYEQKNQSQLASYVGEKLIPVFINWKDEIERVLSPYVMS